MAKAPQSGNREHHHEKHWLDKLAVALSGAAFLAAAFAAVFTGCQALIARDTEKRDLRAYVISNKMQVITYGAKIQDQQEWVISAIIENTGSTPTRYLKIYAMSALGNSIYSMQVGFPWVAIHDGPVRRIPPPVKAVIGPKSEVIGPGFITGASDLSKVRDRMTVIGVAGVATYEDIFGASHWTEFCFDANLPPVDFVHYPIGQAIRADPSFCPQHNCADDECEMDHRAANWSPPVKRPWHFP